MPLTVVAAAAARIHFQEQNIKEMIDTRVGVDGFSAYGNKSIMGLIVREVPENKF